MNLLPKERLTYQHNDVEDPRKHNPCLSAFVLESVKMRKVFFGCDRFLHGLKRFASYALQVRNCSLLVAKSLEPEKRRTSTRKGSAKDAVSNHCLSPHGMYQSGSNSIHGKEYGLESCMEESEALTFWSQAIEVVRTLSDKYVSDEVYRATTDKGLLGYLVSSFFRFIIKNWKVSAMVFEMQGHCIDGLSSGSISFIKNSQLSLLKAGMQQEFE